MMLEASSEFRQANPIKFEELITNQGLNNEEEFGHSHTN